MPKWESLKREHIKQFLMTARAVAPGASREVRGARAVARRALTFARLAPFAQPVLVNGAAGIVSWLAGGRPLSAMGFTVRHGKIVEIDFLADPERLRRLGFLVPGG